jgi:hypothetical protein
MQSALNRPHTRRRPRPRVFTRTGPFSESLAFKRWKKQHFLSNTLPGFEDEDDDEYENDAAEQNRRCVASLFRPTNFLNPQ